MDCQIRIEYPICRNLLSLVLLTRFDRRIRLSRINVSIQTKWAKTFAHVMCWIYWWEQIRPKLSLSSIPFGPHSNIQSQVGVLYCSWTPHIRFCTLHYHHHNQLPCGIKTGKNPRKSLFGVPHNKIIANQLAASKTLSHKDKTWAQFVHRAADDHIMPLTTI